MNNRYIGVIILNTLENTKYIRIRANTLHEAQLMLKYYAEGNYKGRLVSYHTIDTEELEAI